MKLSLRSSRNETAVLKAATTLLSRLGITAKYLGFYYTAHAVMLAVEKPERLRLVTKWLYVDVAKRYNTSALSVEHSIRTIIDVAWRKNREYLCEIAGYEMQKKPSNAEFLAILTLYISL